MKNNIVCKEETVRKTGDRETSNQIIGIMILILDRQNLRQKHY